MEWSNVADYLTGVTVPTERKVRDSYPRTSEDIRAAYEKSTTRAAMMAEYNYPTTQIAKEQTNGFRETIQGDKHKSLSKKSPFTVSF